MCGDVTHAGFRENILKRLMPPIAHERTLRESDELATREAVVDRHGKPAKEPLVDTVEPTHAFSLQLAHGALFQSCFYQGTVDPMKSLAVKSNAQLDRALRPSRDDV